jgi:hypothetical protein
LNLDAARTAWPTPRIARRVLRGVRAMFAVTIRWCDHFDSECHVIAYRILCDLLHTLLAEEQDSARKGAAA